jgi:AraC-like DNA-binding protein
MPESGMSSFSDPVNFQMYLRRAGIGLELSVSGDFRARLTRVELPNLCLLSSYENLARSAYVSLALNRVFITFAARPACAMLWNGVYLQPGDVVFHSQGEQMHQRTTGASHWASISQSPEHLLDYGKALTGMELVPPPVGQLLRLSPSTLANLQQLHASACHLAEAKPGLIEHAGVAHSLEQELIYALVTCLAEAAHCERLAPKRRLTAVMRRFEETLATHREHPQRQAELCEAVGVSERTLRSYCRDSLGMGPSRYVRLRHLMMVRAAMHNADPMMVNVSDIARRHGFAQLGRFAAQYRAVFGETPSTTLRRASGRTV